MARKFGPFDSPPTQFYEVENRRMQRAFNPATGFVKSGQGQVTAGTGAQLVIAAYPDGALIDGLYVENPTTETVTLSTNSGSTNPRIDRLVMRLDMTAKTIAPFQIVGTPAASPAAIPPLVNTSTVVDMPLCRYTMPGSASAQNPTSIVDERVAIAPDGGPAITVLRNVGRQANNVLPGGSQAFGSSGAGRIVVPAGTGDRLARINVDIDVWCPSTSASAGSVRLYANSTELLPNSGDWGSFHNLVSTGTYAARPATAHVRWEGTLPAAAQNLWFNVVSDAGTAAFWVTGIDMTAVYR